MSLRDEDVIGIFMTAFDKNMSVFQYGNSY